MKIALTYGGYMAIASALLNLALFYTGYQTDKLDVGQHFTWLGTIIFIVLLVLGSREEAKNRGALGLSYGGALVSCLLISVFSGLFSAVYTFIHFTFVNPDFPTYLTALTRQKLEGLGIPESQIEAQLSMQAKFLSPLVQSLMAAILTPLSGLFFGLIISIFTRRKAVEEALPPVIENNATQP
jgi:hypothetical protein